ncbi:MAG: YhcH/YjgK/YiaL family protein [Undibacterium sp.]|uniref:YhcH/YjgK/YiaL family protein n=1 Tax=Undibacterium sp. TaxID=1914977 RepID=UPI0027273CA1|nr:YhcH/YjgK/YiaL family protein [Undibacterium sp.]MDO8651742.1 YhcH/YjgK/YiaL family protein [Undibacterium sp.]
MFLSHLQHHTLPMPAVIATALLYLRDTDFSEMQPGKYPIDGDNVFALVQDPLTQPWDAGLPEFHARYLDIQCLLDGEEVIGYSPANASLDKMTDQLAERDIAFVARQADETRLVLTPGMFAIFFPGELHRPCRALHQPMRIKKVVIKISADLIHKIVAE